MENPVRIGADTRIRQLNRGIPDGLKWSSRSTTSGQSGRDLLFRWGVGLLARGIKLHWAFVGIFRGGINL